MVGVDLTANRFACRAVKGARRAACRIDTRTQRNGTHACPPGMYMNGLHVDKDHLLCCPNAAGNEVVDPATGHQATEFAGMHVCGHDGTRVMHGIQASSNRLVCATQR
jgi:hypothetical protein